MSTNPEAIANISVGQRFECDGHKGTIMFLGTLEKSKNPGAVYAGVAWDDPSRGKHDGQHEGRRYFQCAPGCGSFVHPEKLNVGVSFMKAVRDRYCADVTAADEADRFLVAQNRPDRPSFAVPVVFVGQDKAQRKVSELSSLPRISLSQMLVRDCGTDAEQAEMTTSFGALRELDLSGNLFHSWSQLAGIVQHMPSLEELRANQSIFDESVDAAILDHNQSDVAWIRQLKPSFSHLHTLYLHQVPRAFDYVWSLASSDAIPQLTHLSIAGIQLHCFPDCVTPQKAAERFPKLKHFDCSENPIGSWGELNRFASLLPSLTELVANHTHINVIDINSDAQFLHLTFLSLNNGRVRHLNGLAALCALPTLHDFRFQRNPIAETIGTQATRQLVLALLPRLKVLNQSEIRPRERQDSEKHYIKVVHQELNAPITAVPSESSSSAPAVASAFVPHVSSTVAAEAHAVPESAKAAAAAIAARLGAPAEADEPLEALERGAAHKRRRYDELVAVFGPPLEAELASSADNKSGMVELTFRTMDPNQITLPATTKKVPMSMTVLQVKNFLSRLFKLPVEDIILSYKAVGADWPEMWGNLSSGLNDGLPSGDDSKTLEYFGVRSGGQILVENRSAHRNANV